MFLHLSSSAALVPFCGVLKSNTGLTISRILYYFPRIFWLSPYISIRFFSLSAILSPEATHGLFSSCFPRGMAHRVTNCKQTKARGDRASKLSSSCQPGLLAYQLSDMCHANNGASCVSRFIIEEVNTHIRSGDRAL